ncbi:MAG: hypothetical protein FJX71_01100 [Alphaproteobacteria bacterium]|nr:hypothetical protein [Alphaproteobacteria bacterium]
MLEKKVIFKKSSLPSGIVRNTTVMTLATFSLSNAMDLPAIDQSEQDKPRTVLAAASAAASAADFLASQDITKELKDVPSSSASTDSFDRLVHLLNDQKAHFRVVEHAAEGQCDKVAALRGSSIEQSAKAILVSAEITKKQKDYYLLVLAAHQKVDFDKIKAITNAKSVHMSQPVKAQELTGCVMGSIPPFTFHPQLKMIVDPVLIADKAMEMAFNAGRLDRSIFLRVEDYIAITKPTIKSISQ